jgi:hypothetical protein
MVGPPSSTDATVNRSVDALRIVPKPVLVAVRLAAEEIVDRSIPKETELTKGFCFYYPKKSLPCQKIGRATALVAGNKARVRTAVFSFLTGHAGKNRV